MKKILIIALVCLLSACAGKRPQQTVTPKVDRLNHQDWVTIDTPCGKIRTNRVDLVADLLSTQGQDCQAIIDRLAVLAEQNPCASFKTNATTGEITYDGSGCIKKPLVKVLFINRYAVPIWVRIFNLDDQTENGLFKIEAKSFQPTGLREGNYKYSVGWADGSQGVYYSPNYNFYPGRMQNYSAEAQMEADWIIAIPAG